MSRFVKGGSSKASDLIKKANAQLRGERVTRSSKKGSDDEDDLGDYLSGLGSRQSKDVEWDKFGDLSDISVSSGDHGPVQSTPKPSPAPASKFLKKKQPAQNDANYSTAKKPALSAGSPQASKTTAATTKAALSSKSSVLNKAAAFTAKYGNTRKTVSVLSDSDMDMDISMDEEVINDVRHMKGQPPIGKKTESAASLNRNSALVQSVSSLSDISEIGKSGSRFLKKKPQVVSSEETVPVTKPDDDDSEIGGGGSRFLKKKKPKAAAKEPAEKAEVPAKSAKPNSRFQLKSASKHATTVTLDTDEESLADFIDGLSPNSSADVSGAKTPRGIKPPGLKVTSPKSPKSPKSSQSFRQSPELMEDIQEVEENSAASVSSAESFKFNVLDLGDLTPSPSLPPPHKSAKNDTMGKGARKASLTRGRTKTPDKKTKGKPKTPDKKTKSKPKTPDKKKFKPTLSTAGASSNFFSNMGIMSVDDLLGSDNEVSEVSEAASEIYEDIERYSPPLRSILSPTPRSLTPKSARSRVRLSLGDLTEIRSRSPSPEEAIPTVRPNKSGHYSDDFDETEEVKTVRSAEESEIETVSEHSVSSGRSSPPQSIASRRSLRSSRRSSRDSRRKSEDYYSDDFTSDRSSTRRLSRSLSTRSSSIDSTYSDTYTDYTDYSRDSTPSPPPRVKTRSTEVQTGLDPGLLYHWNLHYGPMAAVGPAYGLGTIDPAPIATHVVSADALEALTAYSPSVLALNDMLRSQLQLTRSFLESQRRMHQVYIGGMDPPDHRYTTLEDTKQYIKNHKKPRLTFKKALKQVRIEMGLDT